MQTFLDSFTTFKIPIAVIFGAIVGSFLNVVIYRLPEGISIVKPRSFCPHCRTPIPWYRNIPLFSFIIQQGKCSVCNERISLQYPIVEAISILIWTWGISELYWPESVIFISFVSVLLALSVIDLHTMLLPFPLILCGFLINVITILINVQSFRNAVLGGLIAVLFLGLVYLIVYVLFRKHGLGGGDILLGAISGMWLGPLLIPFAVFLSAVFGLFWTGLLGIRGKFARDKMLPFGPFLSVATLVVYVLNQYCPGCFQWLRLG